MTQHPQCRRYISITSRSSGYACIWFKAAGADLLYAPCNCVTVIHFIKILFLISTDIKLWKCIVIIDVVINDNLAFTTSKKSGLFLRATGANSQGVGRNYRLSGLYL